MEVQLTPDVQAQLDQLSGETGRTREEFVRDALIGYFDELIQLRSLLDRRYDDIKSGRAALLPAEQITEHFRKKSIARRS